MSKFILYILTELNSYRAVHSVDELSGCLSYIKTNNLALNRCLIVSPNGRRITFASNGSMIFGELTSQKASA